MSEGCSYSECSDDDTHTVEFYNGDQYTHCKEHAEAAERDIPGAEIVEYPDDEDDD